MGVAPLVGASGLMVMFVAWPAESTAAIATLVFLVGLPLALAELLRQALDE